MESTLPSEHSTAPATVPLTSSPLPLRPPPAPPPPFGTSPSGLCPGLEEDELGEALASASSARTCCSMWRKGETRRLQPCGSWWRAAVASETLQPFVYSAGATAAPMGIASPVGECSEDTGGVRPLMRSCGGAGGSGLAGQVGGEGAALLPPQPPPCLFPSLPSAAFASAERADAECRGPSAAAAACGRAEGSAGPGAAPDVAGRAAARFWSPAAASGWAGEPMKLPIEAACRSSAGPPAPPPRPPPPLSLEATRFRSAACTAASSCLCAVLRTSPSCCRLRAPSRPQLAPEAPQLNLF